MLRPIFLLGALSALAHAHFTLEWPPSRGFNDDTEPKFPCGGFDSVSSNRTAFPLSGGAPIQLKMGHTESNVQVLLAVGNDPGSAFDIVLRPTFRERGPDDFCIGGIAIPATANLTAGTNATIQVVTNGDPQGGLYQCADITLTDDPVSDAARCSNSSGVTTQTISNPGNANETSEGGSSSASGSKTASSTAASSTASAGAAAVPFGSWSAIWAFGAAAAGGVAAIL